MKYKNLLLISAPTIVCCVFPPLHFAISKVVRSLLPLYKADLSCPNLLTVFTTFCGSKKNFTSPDLKRHCIHKYLNCAETRISCNGTATHLKIFVRYDLSFFYFKYRSILFNLTFFSVKNNNNNNNSNKEIKIKVLK